MAMLLEWSFDEASGDVIDHTGNGRGFALTGTSVRAAGDTMGGAAPSSKALTQTSAVVQAGPAIAGLNTNARTIMFKVRTGSDPAQNYWVMEYHRAAENTGVFGLLNLFSQLRFRAKNSSNVAFDINLATDAVAYHHIAVTHDGVNTLKVYRDGVQVGADVDMGGIVWAADTLRVFDAGSDPFLDHVRIFDTALTVAEINTWMNTPTPTESSGGSGGPMDTISDIQAQKLPVLTGKTGSVQDLLHAYYGGLSGLVPVAAFSVADHQRVYWETQTGLSGRSLADLEKAFYDAQLVPSGSLGDRAYLYWLGL